MPKKKKKREETVKKAVPQRIEEGTLRAVEDAEASEILPVQFKGYSKAKPAEAQKVWPVAPEFPPEINYYDAEKIEGFRRAYAAFKREYEEALKA